MEKYYVTNNDPLLKIKKWLFKHAIDNIQKYNCVLVYTNDHLKIKIKPKKYAQSNSSI